MTKKTASIDSLELLHNALVESLTQKIKDGSATAAEYNVIRQLLKDNGIDAQPTADSGLALLRDSLPFASSAKEIEDEDIHYN